MLSNDCYEKIEACPWCKNKQFNLLFTQITGDDVRECKGCGLVYSSIKLNKKGLNEYWDNYESKVHVSEASIDYKRREMYKVEFELIRPFIKENGVILDVGCSDGGFLDLFCDAGYQCEGTEYGREAYDLARKKYQCYFGNLEDLQINKKYDLIIFRGTLQFLIHPQECLKKAIDLLNNEGIIFITSSPNSNSICFRLFREQFTLPVNATDYCMYNESIVTNFMVQNQMTKVFSTHLYLGTPYESRYDDIVAVGMAIEAEKQGERISMKSPAFFDNMLTLVYKKGILING